MVGGFFHLDSVGCGVLAMALWQHSAYSGDIVEALAVVLV